MRTLAHGVDADVDDDDGAYMAMNATHDVAVLNVA